MISNETVCEFLLNVPIPVEQLIEIKIYRQDKLSGVIPGNNVCALKKRLAMCSLPCSDSEADFLSNEEAKIFPEMLNKVIKCAN